MAPTTRSSNTKYEATPNIIKLGIRGKSRTVKNNQGGALLISGSKFGDVVSASLVEKRIMDVQKWVDERMERDCAVLREKMSAPNYAYAKAMVEHFKIAHAAAMRAPQKRPISMKEDRRMLDNYQRMLYLHENEGDTADAIARTHLCGILHDLLSNADRAYQDYCEGIGTVTLPRSSFLL